MKGSSIKGRCSEFNSIVMKGGQLPGIRAGYSLCVDIVTHLFSSMVNACSHIYL